MKGMASWHDTASHTHLRVLYSECKSEQAQPKRSDFHISSPTTVQSVIQRCGDNSRTVLYYRRTCGTLMVSVIISQVGRIYRINCPLLKLSPLHASR
jgi:hypothetical protein